MKSIILSIVFFFGALHMMAAQQETLNKLFDKYENVDGVTSIKIAKPMFSLLGSLNVQNSEFKQLSPILNKMEGLKILVVEKQDEKSKNKNQLNNLKQELLSAVNNLKYQELMTVNNNDAKIKFLTPEIKNGILNNLLLSINSGDDTVLLMMDGKISMDDLTKLMSESKINQSADSSKSTSSSEVRRLENFNAIECSTGVKIFFTPSDVQKVSVDTDAGMQPYLVTEVKNGTLKVYIDKKDKKSINLTKAIVRIEAPKLDVLTLTSGSTFNSVGKISGKEILLKTTSGANVKADLTMSKNVQIQSTSGSKLQLNLETKNLDLSATSGAEIRLKGTADQATYQLTSAASCDAFDVETKNVTASATSSAQLNLSATDFLKATATSGAQIRYAGNPKKTEIENNSSGTVKKIN